MIYYQRSDGAYCSCVGMTQDQIVALLQEQGLTCTFIDQAAYQTAIAAQLI